MQESETLTVKIDADTRDIETSMRAVGTLTERFGRTMTGAFKDAVVGGKSFRDIVQSIGQRLSRLTLEAATKPLESLLGSSFESLFQGVLPFARGGVTGTPMPIPFAQGGIVSRPTYFPLDNRRMGLAGEAGTEAILPLRRGQDGRLGVAATGSVPGTTINFNVTATDADSFRRSESQIAAMVQRAAARGQRNL